MNDNKVFVEAHPFAVLLGMQHKNVPSLLCQSELPTMQCIVKRFRYFEEVIPACNDFPASFDLEFVE